MKITRSSVPSSRGAALALAASLLASLALGAPALAQAVKPANPDQAKEQLRQRAKEAGQRLREEKRSGEQIVNPATGQEIPGATQAGPQVPATPAGPAGAITFTNPQHDFGKVMDTKQPLICKFDFKNTGPGKLVISAINTGCGCTAAKLAKQEFEPGEGDAIEITYNPKSTGKASRQITVVTNDPANPNFQLTISANVVPIVEARPSTLQFGQVPVGEARTLPVLIVGRDPNLKITGVEVNGTELEASIVAETPAPDASNPADPDLPGRALINVTLKESTPPGRVLKQVTLKVMAAKETDQPQEEQVVQVNTFAAVSGEIEVQPQFIRVPPVQPGESFQREVVVMRQGGKPFAVTGATAAAAGQAVADLVVETAPHDVGANKGYKVILKGKAPATPGAFRGVITVNTDMPREPKVEVQFSGIVRAVAANSAGAPGSSPANAIPVTPSPAKP